MKKLFKYILSWNWSFLFWSMFSMYWLQKFSDPALLEKVPGGAWGASFLVIMTLV